MESAELKKEAAGRSGDRTGLHRGVNLRDACVGAGKVVACTTPGGTHSMHETFASRQVFCQGFCRCATVGKQRQYAPVAQLVEPLLCSQSGSVAGSSPAGGCFSVPPHEDGFGPCTRETEARGAAILPVFGAGLAKKFKQKGALEKISPLELLQGAVRNRLSSMCHLVRETWGHLLPWVAELVDAPCREKRGGLLTGAAGSNPAPGICGA